MPADHFCTLVSALLTTRSRLRLKLFPPADPSRPPSVDMDGNPDVTD